MKIVLVDQLCFAPVALTSFYVGLSALELKSVEEIKEEWKSKFPKTWAVRQNIDKRSSPCLWFLPLCCRLVSCTGHLFKQPTSHLCRLKIGLWLLVSCLSSGQWGCHFSKTKSILKIVIKSKCTLTSISIRLVKSRSIVLSFDSCQRVYFLSIIKVCITGSYIKRRQLRGKCR